MNNAAGITRTKFGSEAVMKSEAAPRISETPFLRAEVPLVNAEMGPLPSVCQKKFVRNETGRTAEFFFPVRVKWPVFFGRLKKKTYLCSHYMSEQLNVNEP